MELFARDMILSGPPSDVRTWATEVAESFEAVTGRHVNVWTSVVGGRAGHYSWGYQVDGAAEIVEHTMAALADEDYLAKIEEGREFFTDQPTDTLYRAYGELGEDRTRPGNVAYVTQAVAEAGALGHAVGWGIEASEYVQRVTGLYNVLLGEAAGDFARLTWMGIAKDMAQADEAQRTINSDDGYLKLIARGGEFFQTGSARSQFFLRIA